MQFFIAYLKLNYINQQIYFVQSKNINEAKEFLKSQLDFDKFEWLDSSINSGSFLIIEGQFTHSLEIYPLEQAFEQNQNDAFFITKYNDQIVMQHKID